MVLIEDCHVSYNTSYPVYTNGLALDGGVAPNVTNIYVRQPNGVDDFVGNCWPGPSVWLDYLNANAQKYWASLYAYKNFHGTSYLYGAWNDMNEPSVFADGSLEEIAQRGMPVHNIHIDINGNQFEHMYVHNAYGALQQNSTYMGLYERDYGQNRPFMLTRSFFLGSQRYSGMWTGDSQTNYENVEMSVNMLLSLGVSGIVFGGCDIPGFYGEPSDDLFIQFYQLGVFYPFMRAHNNIPRDTIAESDNFSRREPWLQSERIQKVIRASIAQRYAQIHYLYTAFYQANT
jgi:mannosyl-oligosaccharide alpha-1,3-glucosidase